MKKIFAIAAILACLCLNFKQTAHAIGSVCTSSSPGAYCLTLTNGSVCSCADEQLNRGDGSSVVRTVTMTLTGSATGGTVSHFTTDQILVPYSRPSKITLTQYLRGFALYDGKVIPGTTAPTNLFSLTVADQDGLDLTQGSLSSLPNNAVTWESFGSGTVNGSPCIDSPLTISLSGSTVNSATVTLKFDVIR